MSYLHAHPGFRQMIVKKIYTVKWMHSSKEGANQCLKNAKKSGKYKEVVRYNRKKNGKLFGKHPYCVAVRGRK